MICTGCGILGNLELAFMEARTAMCDASAKRSLKKHKKLVEKCDREYEKKISDAIDEIRSILESDADAEEKDRKINRILANAEDDEAEAKMRAGLKKIKSEEYKSKMDNTSKEFFDFVSMIAEFDEKRLSKETIMKNDFFYQLYDVCKEDKQDQVLQYFSKLAELIRYMKKDIDDELDEEDIEVMKEKIPEWIKAVQAVRKCLAM